MEEWVSRREHDSEIKRLDGEIATLRTNITALQAREEIRNEDRVKTAVQLGGAIQRIGTLTMLMTLLGAALGYWLKSR